MGNAQRCEIYVNTNVSRTWPSRQLALGGQNKTTPLLGYWGSNSVSNLFVALRDLNAFYGKFPIKKGLDHPNEISAYMISEFFPDIAPISK